MRASGPRRVVVAALALALASFPQFRGAYFRGEQLAAVAVIGLAAAGAAATGMVARPRTRADWLALAVAGAAIASLPVAVDTRAAIQHALLALTLGAVYALARAAGDPAVLHGILAGSSLAAVLAVAAAAGQFRLADAVLAGRLASTLQYPNTSAAYWTVGVFVTLGLWQAARHPLARIGYAVAAEACFLAFVFALSRGGYLVFPLAALGYWLACPRGRRAYAALQLAALALALLPAAPVFYRGLRDTLPAWAWGGLAIAVAGAGALAASMEAFFRLPERARRAAFVAAGAAVAAALLAAAAHPEAVPAAVRERARAIRLSEYSAWERLQWTRDALEMVRARPVLGWGGGGWDAAYRAFQDYAYHTQHPHNDFVERWVEYGTVGFLAWLALWAAVGRAAVRGWRAAGDDAHRARIAATAAATGALGLHSLIDFHLALFAVAMTLWALFGTLAAEEPPPPAAPASLGRRARAERERRARSLRLATAAACLALSAFSLVLLGGYVLGQRAAAAMAAGDRETAERLFDRALRLDPWTASFYADRATLTLERVARGEGSEADVQRARADLERALRLDGHDANIHTLYAALLLQLGEFEPGVRHFEQAVRLNPYAVERWENLAAGYVLLGRLALERGDRAAARAHLQAALGVRDRVADLAARIPPPVPDVYRMPADTPGLRLAAGQAHALLGRWREAVAHLRAAADGGDPDVRPEAVLWLALVLDVQGEAAEAAKLRAEAFRLQPAYRPLYGPLREVLARAR